MTMFSSAARATRIAQGCIFRSRRASEQNSKKIAGATTCVSLVLAASTISSRCSSDGTIAVEERRIRSDSALISSSVLLRSKRVRCDDDSSSAPLSPNSNTDALDEYEEDDTGYTEAERFFQALDYHRSLLFDYHRRWGPYDPDGKATSSNDKEVNRSRKWPRHIPDKQQVGALSRDLHFCMRSPTPQARKCHDLQFRIATYYTTLKDDESQRKGFKLVKTLAEQGHPDGMCYYGILLNEGEVEGVDANPQQAVVWWRRCVDRHKHIQASYELATAFYLGEGVPENPEHAVRLFRRAAHLGHAGSAYMLGECLLDGVGVARDRANALEWLVTAAELGHQLARSRVITVLYEEYSNLEAGMAEEERKKEENAKWINDVEADEVIVQSVNIERRYSIGGGSRNPAVQARRKTKVKESRDEPPL